MVRKLLGLALALGAMLAAVPASATMIYAFAGTFSGKLTTHLDTTPVSRTFSDLDLAFVGISDGTPGTIDSALTAIVGSDVYSFSLDQFGITDGSSFISLSGFSFVTAPDEDLIGFVGPQGVLFSVQLPVSYDGTSDYAPSGFSDIVRSQALTIGNRKIKLNHVTDATGGQFLAFDIPAVPESATWAMFILGFGTIGFGLRRRAPAHRLTA